MSNLLLESYIKAILETRRDLPLRQFHGSNFHYTMEEYMTTVDGLAEFCVSYSNYPKWGIAPNTNFFPKGVYFYFLSPQCRAGVGDGFATDREYANIAKINYDRMVVLKEGHAKNFSETDCDKALKTLLQKFPNLVVKDNDKWNPTEENQAFNKLINVVKRNAFSLNIGFNKLLFEAGYYGIVDFKGIYLPIESCQGVQTYPGGADLVESIRKTTAGADNPEKRHGNLMKNLRHRQPGSLKLAPDEVGTILGSMPKYDHHWDDKAHQKDIIGLLLRALDLKHDGMWNAWAAPQLNKYGVGGFEVDLEINPTTPHEVWEKLQYHRDEGVRLTAKDMLKALAA